MKKLISLTAGAALMFFSSWTCADLTASKQLSERLSGMQAFQADFVQTVMDEQGHMLQTTQGEMAVQRPGLFRWQAEAPLEQLVVSDGQQLWSYDPDLEQVSVQAMEQRLTQTPALLLSGEIDDLAESYDVSSFKISEQVWQFHLTPKATDSLFETLRLTFAENTLVQMHLLDSLGQHSSLEFKNVKVNTVLDDSLFQFSPPEGVDVIIQ